MKVPVYYVGLVIVLSCLYSVGNANHFRTSQDINLPEIQLLEVPSVKKLHREKRKILFFKRDPTKKWPTTINFMLDVSLSPTFRAHVLDVLSKDFEAKTCLKFNQIFSPNATQHQFILFRGHDVTDRISCKAYIGKENDTRTFHGQPIYLSSDCFKVRGQLIHMIGATLGMFNEVQRSDRDNYVDIFWENIDQLGQVNFHKSSDTAVVTHDVPYDYASALHFPAKAWIKAGGNYSVLPKDRSLTHLLGQASEISFYDVQVLNHAYCDHVCTNTIICHNKGYQDPKDCSRCRCPDGYTGTQCEEVGPGSAQCNPRSGRLAATHNLQCVNSPGYGITNYNLGDMCAWLLQAPPGRLIDMWFYETQFSLPYINRGDKVCLHWVEVKYKGLNQTRGVRYCSKDNLPAQTSTLPVKFKPVTSEASEVLVTFHAPDADLLINTSPEAMTGFKLCYILSDKLLTTPTSTVAAPSSDMSGDVSVVISDSFSMIILIVAVIAVLLLLLLIFGIVIICLIRRRRKQPEAVVVASGLNNPGYGEHSFPVVSLQDVNLDKKMAAFGATGDSVDVLPPQYDDVPTADYSPPYAISGNMVTPQGAAPDYSPPQPGDTANLPAPDYSPPQPRDTANLPAPDYSPAQPRDTANLDYQSDSGNVYETPVTGGNDGIYPMYDTPVSDATAGNADEPIYENTGRINNLRQKFEQPS